MNTGLVKNWMQLNIRLKKLKSSFSTSSDLRMNEIWALRRIDLATRDRGACIGNTEIQEELQVTKSAVSQMIDSLVEKGYVNRTPDASDRRRLCVTLTPSGEQILARMSRTMNALADGVAKKMGEEKISQMFDLMNEFLDHFSDLQAQMDQTGSIADPANASPADTRRNEP